MQTLANIAQAYNNALNLAVFAGIFTKESTPIMIQKAFRQARAVSIEAEFIEPETAADILAKAERQAMALKALVILEENA